MTAQTQAEPVRLTLAVTVTPAALTRIKEVYGLDLTAADLAHLLAEDLRGGLVGQAAGAGLTVAVAADTRSAA